MSPRAAFWVTDILADDEARAYVFGRGGSLEFPFTVAVKTGTSQAYRDNWTIGYTREVTVGVWVGNFDREPLTGSSGVTGAGPIFHAVMLAAQQHVRGRDAIDEAIVARPADLSEHTICGLSGMRAGEACPLRTREWLPGTSSPLPCNWHHHSEDGLLTLWPEPYRAWAAAKGLLEEESARHLAARATVASRQARGRVNAAPTPHMDEHGPESFAILSPADGATYLIDPTLRADFQRVPLRAWRGSWRGRMAHRRSHRRRRRWRRGVAPRARCPSSARARRLRTDGRGPHHHQIAATPTVCPSIREPCKRAQETRLRLIVRASRGRASVVLASRPRSGTGVSDGNEGRMAAEPTT